MEFIPVAIVSVVVLGGLWTISKFAPPGITAVACLIVAAGGFASGGVTRILGFIGLVMFFVTLVEIFGPRQNKGDVGLVACPNCGRKVSPDSPICPRCETRLAG
jgi:hypothetical protein